MRNFDLLGIELAQYQGEIFAKSISRYNCSSLVFIRRFRFSNYALKLDNANNCFLLDEYEAFNELDREYKDTSYGKNKYSKEALYWLGYIYRYICYTRNITTKNAFKLFDYKKLLNNYYVYHTQSEEWVISRILDATNKREEVFDINKNIKEKLKIRYKDLLGNI